MREFLSIKEVADYLGVDYKTIYRLVQQAEIPAAKVGGVYRIPRQEVEAYFERKRQELVRQAAECPLKCGRCLRLLAPYDMEGLCSADDCREPLCRSCWEADPDHRCRLHVLSREQRLSAARTQLEQGMVPLLLTSDEARRREVMYLGRLEAKWYRRSSLPNPLTGKPVRVSNWEAIRTRAQDLERFLEAGQECLDAGSGLCPTNPRLTFRPARGLVLEVLVHSDLATHLRQGFVTQATSHTALFEQLSRAIDRAEAEDSLAVVGLAATAGWDAEAVQLVKGAEGGSRPFFHRRLAPVLVDLAREQVVYNATDARLDGLAELFSPEMEQDVVQQVMSATETLLNTGRSGVLLSEVVDMGLASADRVAEAFDRLAATKKYHVTEMGHRDRLLERRQPAA